MEILIHPQLCKTYNNQPLTKPMLLEPKFDGLRGIVVIDANGKAQVFSRNGKPLWNVDHILKELEEKVGDDPSGGWVLDGEFYTLDWNLSMSILKRQSPHPSALQIRYHVWDLLTLDEWLNGGTDRPLKERKELLYQHVSHLSFTQYVDAKWVHNADELSIGYTEFLEAGYEGAILKDPDSVYSLGTRSPGWLKVKPWTDADLKILDAGEGKGRLVGKLGFLVLEGNAEWKGKDYEVHTEVGTGFTDEVRDKLWALHKKKKLVGKVAEIKFQDITVDGSCRFPVFHRLREDK